MSNFQDLTGIKFNRLTVISRAENQGKNTTWLCECDCGIRKIVRASSLKNGVVQSCGCLYREKIGSLNRTHGDTGTKLYNAWLNMKARCYRPSAREYQNYGGRGITVCKEWKERYETFRDWAITHGYADNLTLDRKDVNGNYCPENCCWISNKEQQNNKRNNVVYEFNGEVKTLAQWAESIGISSNALKKRIRKWGVAKALTTPKMKGSDDY